MQTLHGHLSQLVFLQVEVLESRFLGSERALGDGPDLASGQLDVLEAQPAEDVVGQDADGAVVDVEQLDVDIARVRVQGVEQQLEVDHVALDGQLLSDVESADARRLEFLDLAVPRTLGGRRRQRRHGDQGRDQPPRHSATRGALLRTVVHEPFRTYISSLDSKFASPKSMIPFCYKRLEGRS